MEFRGAALPPRVRALPARLGLRLARHDPARPAGEGDRAVPGVRGRERRGGGRLEDPAPGAGRGVPEAPAPLRAPVRRPRRGRTWWSGSRRSPTATSSATGSWRTRDVGRPAYPRRGHAIEPARRYTDGCWPTPSGEPQLMEKPFAITLDVGSSRANKTGSWRTERAVYVDRLPPCNHACPAGENIQQWLYHAEEGGEGYERALAPDHGGQPVPRDHGAGLLPPLRDRLQPRPARRGRRHQLGRALPRRQGDQAGLDGRGGRRAVRQAGAGGGRGALGPVGGLPPDAARPRGHDPRGRADDRRHDALRDTEVPAAARRARRRGGAHPRHGREARARTARSTNIEEAMREGGFDAAFLAVGAHIAQAGLHPRRAGGAHPGRRLGAAEHGGRGAADARPARGRLRRRQHRDGRGPHRQAARRRGGDRGLPAHPRAHARPRLRGRGGRARRAC